MQIRFREFLLDEERYVLERSGRRLAIRPKVFDLLVYLARNRRRVVRREELVQVLWGGAVVGPGSLSGLVNELRQVLGENGREASSIRTVHARGYQFVAPVESLDPVERSGPSSDPSASADDAAGGASAEAARLVGVVAERGARGVLVESPASGLPEARPILAASARAGFEVLRRASPTSSPAAFDAFARALVDWAGGASAPAPRMPGEPGPRAVSCLQEGRVDGVARHRVGAGPGDDWAALASILSERSRRQPLTLVIEDVARSGIGFAAALSRLVVRLDTAPVLVVALASRDEGAGPSRGGWRRALLRDPSFSTWRLDAAPDRSPLAHALQQSGMTESLVAAFDAEVNASPRLRAALREWLGPATTEAEGSIGTSTGRAPDPTSSGDLDVASPLCSPSVSGGGSVASSGGSVASSGGSVGGRGVRRVEPGRARGALQDARSDGNRT